LKNVGPTAVDILAGAVASANVSEVGRLLLVLAADTVEVSVVPASVVRKVPKCSLLDVAVGAGAEDVTRCLLEFHGMKPSQQALKMAISTGRVDLIWMVRERLPEIKHELELLEVAADFHRPAPLTWLLGEVTDFEREEFFGFAIEHKLADANLTAVENGYRPWSWHTQECAS
jgi:hypothetical protein